MKNKKQTKPRGRPIAEDKRQQLPFRLKGSLVAKCKEKGQQWLEALIFESK
tara:strand:- start:93 stop:245 length:153 start_codon:yes stop_codon:yes gene_type:complete